MQPDKVSKHSEALGSYRARYFNQETKIELKRDRIFYLLFFFFNLMLPFLLGVEPLFANKVAM